MKLEQRQLLLKTAEQICQQADYKIPESYFSSTPMLTTVSHLMMMSFAVVQLIHLVTKNNKVPTNFSEEEQRIALFLLEKIAYS